MDRVGRMKATKPLFVDFTWGAGGSTADLTLELTLRAKNEHGLVPNMHLTCTNMPVEKIDNALAKCKVFQGTYVHDVICVYAGGFLLFFWAFSFLFCCFRFWTHFTR